MIPMDKLKEILATWKDEILNTAAFDREIYREIREQFSKPFSLVLHGLRRSGKTYLMYKLFQEHPNAIYVNFEDERFTGAGSEVLDELYAAYMGYYLKKSGTKSLCF